MATIPQGLTTAEALSLLRRHIEGVLQEHLAQSRWHIVRRLSFDAWGLSSQLTVFKWPAALALTLIAFLFIGTGFYAGYDRRFRCLTAFGIVLLLLCLVNLSVVFREAYLRYTEMPFLVKSLINILQEQTKRAKWQSEQYPHLHCPLSPCISLQWTVRDGHIVNLPVVLLVEGDTVMLRPGQRLPATCLPLNSGTPLVDAHTLQAGSIFTPGTGAAGSEGLTSPKVRLPSLPQPHVVTETPYVKLLREVLEQALRRPVSVYMMQRNKMAWGLEALLVPFTAFACVLLCGLRLWYGLWLTSGLFPTSDSTTFANLTSFASDLPSPEMLDAIEALLVVPCCVVLPLLPVLIPIVWVLMTIHGTAVLLTQHAVAGVAAPASGCEVDTNVRHQRDASTGTFNAKTGSDWNNQRSGHYFSHTLESGDSAHLCPPDQSPSSEDSATSSLLPKLGEVSMLRVLEQAIRLWRGDVTSCIRGSNILHVLASLTNLCCVDKKGILSWANPTAEKLFFLRNKTPINTHSATAKSASRCNLHGSIVSLGTEDEVFSSQPDQQFTFNPPCTLSASSSSNTAGISASPSLGTAQQSAVIGNPDPISATAAPHYCASPHNLGESDPVLLSLTHQIDAPFKLSFDDPEWRNYLGSLKPLGLSVLLNTCHPDTQSHYTTFCSHLTHEASYTLDLVPVSQRRCLCELSEQIGFSRSAHEPFKLEHQLSIYRHVPAEMSCKDRLARSLMVTKLKFPFPHMMSVLMRDTNTQKLELLTQGTADIVLDSCSDYWDGSDLSPLTDKDRKKLLDFYHRTSLSAYCTAFSYRPSPCMLNTQLTQLYMELPTDPAHIYTHSPTPHNSTEALFGDECHTEYEEIDDVEDLFRMQCKQIFLGMVTMQYQAKTDMVQLIEQLESACVRFVHFSKENELRSRVFSEKMGMESGWNCHISLLDDKTRCDESVCSSSRAGQHLGASLLRISTEDVATLSAFNVKNRLFRRKILKRKLTRGRSLLESSRVLCHSAPSNINLDAAPVKFEDEVSVYSTASSASSSNLDRHCFQSGDQLSHSGLASQVLHLGRDAVHDSLLIAHQSPLHSHHSCSPHYLPYNRRHHRRHRRHHTGQSPSPVTSSVLSTHSPWIPPLPSLSSSNPITNQALSHFSGDIFPPARCEHSAPLRINSTPQPPQSDCIVASADDQYDSSIALLTNQVLESSSRPGSAQHTYSETNKPACEVVRVKTNKANGATNPPDLLVGSENVLLAAASAAGSSVNAEDEDCESDDEDEEGFQPVILDNVSHTTTSSDRSTCFNFDMSNTARLPKGINNIRPHLKDVDNVPLLVSLFTDCTPATTKQMLEIMIENNEVVVLMGSSQNIENISMFVATDASVGVSPMHPVVCKRVPVMSPPPDGVLSPTSLAARLQTLPCALVFNRRGPLPLVRLIEKARHLMQCCTNSLQFWVSCCCSLAIVQFLALLALLPPILHPGDVLWLTLVCFPLLSLSLYANPHNPEVMRQATGKNTLPSNGELLRFVAAHYGSKFLPTLLVVLSFTTLALRGMCGRITHTENSHVTTHGLLLTTTSTDTLDFDDINISALTYNVTGMLDNGSVSNSSNSSSLAEFDYLASNDSTGEMPMTDAPVRDVGPLVIADNKVTDLPFSEKETAGMETTTTAALDEVVSYQSECFFVYQKRYDARDESLKLLPGWGPYYAESVRLVQVCTAFILLVYFCIISVSFVHRMEQVWKKNPFANRVWVVTVPCLLLLHLLYSLLVWWKLKRNMIVTETVGLGVASVSLEAWLLALVWGAVLLPLNELLKRREIRANKRYQKKARLEFGTKLGMNSPF